MENKVVKGLLTEIKKAQNKRPARHHVPGFRQTANREAILATLQDKQRVAIRWRERIVELEPDGELRFRAAVSLPRFVGNTQNIRVFLKGDRIVAIVNATRQGITFLDAPKEELDEILRDRFNMVRSKK